MEILRSLLVVPGNRPDMLEKARSLPVDAFILNLEDSVPVGEKERARKTIAGVLKGYAKGGQGVIVQINSLDSGLAWEDLEATVCPHIDAVAVSKCRSGDEVRELDRLVAVLESRHGMAPGTIKLLVWVEIAIGVARALELASASRRTVAVTFGGEDFILDMGIERSPTGEEFMYPRAALAIAARAAGVYCIDTPYVNFRDTEGLVKEAGLARRLGFTGKLAIHPSQIEPINRTFSPTQEEVSYARRVIQAFEEAVAQGKGVTSLDGRMIEAPTYKRATDLLRMAEAVSKRATSQG